MALRRGTGDQVLAASHAERRFLLLASLWSGAVWGLIPIMLPALQRLTATTDAEVGLALGAMAAAALPVMLWSGPWADRVGPVDALQTLLVASALTLPLLGLATNLTGLVLALVLLGLATGAYDVALNAGAGEWERRSGTPHIALVHAAAAFGALLGALGGGLARHGGLSPLPALLMMAAGAAVLAARPSPPRPESVVRTPALGLDYLQSRLRVRLVAVGTLLAAALLVEDGLQTWIAVHLERDHDVLPTTSGLAVALFAGSMCAGRLSAHAFARRVPDDCLLLGAGALTALGSLLFATGGSPAWALAGLGLAGAGCSVVAPVLLSEVSRRSAPGSAGADQAVVNSLGYVGLAVSPPLVGLVSALHSLQTALIALGGASLVTCLVAGALLSRGRRLAGSGSR